jgi:ribosomal protein S6
MKEDKEVSKYTVSHKWATTLQASASVHQQLKRKLEIEGSQLTLMVSKREETLNVSAPAHCQLKRE